MFDITNLIPVTGPKVAIFYGSKIASQITDTGWQCWTRPKNATMLMLICVGSGGGGGGGLTGAAGTNRGGGGGGGSGSFARLIIPAFFLPKTLFLLPGTGGKGSAAGIAGIAGEFSSIRDKVNTGVGNGSSTIQDTILISGSDPVGGTAGRGGVGGSAAGGNAGGAAEIVAIVGSTIYKGYGLWESTVGQNGTASGALAAPGASLTFGATSVLVSGGTGGGSVSATNVDQAGGAITGAGLIATQPGGVAAAGAGSSGLRLQTPLINTGGTGGGTAGAAGTAGKGGDGAPGSGGGGGGGGVTGGAGGDGGPGFIMIVSW